MTIVAGLPCTLLLHLELAATQPQASPTFRSGARLVLVNVVARDKNGAVGDLRASGFALFDGGKPRPIQSFSVAYFSESVGEEVRLPPNTFSNSIDRQAVRPVSATVVLIDGLNTRIEHQAFARQRLVSLLKQIQPRERIALYLLGGSLRVLHDFTNDPMELARILSRYRGEVSSSLAASEPQREATGSPEVDRLLEELNAITEDRGKVERARVTLAALDAIANHLSVVPGRKNLVWVSSGFPSSVGVDDPSLWFQRSVGMGSAREVRTFHEELERAARRINQANIAVYPVDAGGLATSPAFKSASIGTGSTQFPGSPPRADATGSTRATMERLAARTGGRAFFDSNDLDRAIRQAIEDSDITYTLGFYPAAEELDGKFHELRVQTRRRGVRLRYRKGYFALADGAPSGDQAQQQLREAVASPLEAHAIRLTLRLERTGSATVPALRVVLNADVRDLALDQNQEKRTGALDVILVQQEASGAVLDSSKDTVRLDMTPGAYAAALEGGIAIGKMLTLKERAATIRALARDPSSGAIGSVIVPLSRVN